MHVHQNKHEMFNTFFQRLSYGERFNCEVGKRPENRSKNRFKTTFPCMYIN